MRTDSILGMSFLRGGKSLVFAQGDRTTILATVRKLEDGELILAEKARLFNSGTVLSLHGNVEYFVESIEEAGGMSYSILLSRIL